MTINDLPLNTQIREIHRASSRLDYLTREGRELELFRELLSIYRAADKALEAMNRARWPDKESA